MTADDANKLLALAKANYSYAFKTMTKQEKIMLVQSWAFALQDIPADIVMLAFMQLLTTSKWLPTVAEPVSRPAGGSKGQGIHCGKRLQAARGRRFARIEP